MPIVAWFALYGWVLSRFLPQMRERSRAMSEMRSVLTGKIVDSYTNILTVKLFARARDEDAFVRAAVDEHTETWRAQQRIGTWWGLCLQAINALLMVGTGALAIGLWVTGHIAVGTVATAIPMAWQINTMSGVLAQQIANIFDDVGQVQDGMRSIAVARQMPDLPGAVELPRVTGAIRFENVSFDYGREARRGGVLRGLDLDVAPGERVGLVGRSGAGKSTLVHLLLGFYRPESGRILIDGRDIAGLTQESLRAQIGMVTQDTSLLHRSIRDNIRYGRPDASEAEIVDAARRAHALEFIEGLEDWHGRTGLRRACRRTRRQTVRRAAAAHRAGARHPEGRADPGARRGDLGARFRGRGGDPGAARAADGGAHGHRDRAPALDDLPDGPALRARSRPHRRTGHARASAGRRAAPMPCCGGGNRAGSGSIASATPRETRRTARGSTRFGCNGGAAYPIIRSAPPRVAPAAIISDAM